MAKTTETTKRPEPVKIKRTFTLELSEGEARVIYALVGLSVGSIESSRRKFATAVWDSLRFFLGSESNYSRYGDIQFTEQGNIRFHDRPDLVEEQE